MAGVTSKYFLTTRTSKINALHKLMHNTPRKPVKIKYEGTNNIKKEVLDTDDVIDAKKKKDNTVHKDIEHQGEIRIKKEVLDTDDNIDTRIKKEDTDYASNHTENTDCWFPSNWHLLLHNIKEMRKDRTAVVDSQGCERTADLHEKPEVIRYQTLISLMLSSQTRDQVTFAAMQRLKEYGLTANKMMQTSEEKIGKLIYPVGFWKRKSKYIKETSKLLHDNFNGDIPNSIKGLTSLPGVGPKMAYICMNAAWGQVDGIGVDTHVHRISNRLKWVKKTTKTPEQTRLALEAWLPR